MKKIRVNYIEMPLSQYVSLIVSNVDYIKYDFSWLEPFVFAPLDIYNQYIIRIDKKGRREVGFAGDAWTIK